MNVKGNGDEANEVVKMACFIDGIHYSSNACIVTY